MNYEDMTDDQIDRAVTEVIARRGKEAARIGGVLISELGLISYCNDWAYGGLVIQSAKISVIKTDDDCWTAFEWENDENEQWHEKPLRAAMIVFLMMNEG